MWTPSARGTRDSGDHGPSSDGVLSLTLNIDGGNAEYSYMMFNGMGQMVANGKAQGTEQINVSDMAKGVYFLRITTGTQVRVEKVVVE